MAPSGITLPPRPPEELLARCDPAIVAYITALEEVLRKVLGHLDEQEAALRAAKRQATPFRRPGRKKKRKKPGRKGGHARASRPEVDHVDEDASAELPLSCPCCGGTAIDEDHTYEQVQEDLEIRKVVRRILVHVGVCYDCGATVEGRHPFQTSRARGAASQQIGPTALGLAAHLHYQQGVPFERIAEIFEQLGLGVAKATLVRAMHRLAGRAEAAFQELLHKVLQQDVLHIDETSWSIDGQPHYLWVLTGRDATVYFVRQTRSGDEVADFLADFEGVLVTDGYRGYDEIGKRLLRALCLLHLKRNFRQLEEKTQARGKALPRDLAWWVDDVIAVLAAHRDNEFEDDEFAQISADLESQFLDLLDTRPTNAANARMVQRLLKWQDAVLRCLRVEGVPATNNHAERQIRPAVVLRKRGGCNRSERGARTFERLGSIAATRAQHGLPLLDWFSRLLCSMGEPLGVLA
jgi:transposase